MKVKTAKVTEADGRRIEDKSDVEGSDEIGILRNVRIRADVQLYLTPEQVEDVNQGNFEYLPETMRIVFTDERKPEADLP
jgi:hypothetical protein